MMATIRLDRSAIANAHRQAGLEDPTRDEGVRMTLAGLARQDPRPQAQARGLTAGALAAVRATACLPRELGGVGQRRETGAASRARGMVDIAICAVMRDGLLRRSEAAALVWADIDVGEDGTGRVTVRHSKSDQEGEGAVLFLGRPTVQDLEAIRPVGHRPGDRVFGVGAAGIGRRMRQAAIHAGLGDGFSGHSGRVGMAQDLSAGNTSLAALQTAGRWQSPTMPVRYTRKQAAGLGAVARYYQDGASNLP